MQGPRDKCALAYFLGGKNMVLADFRDCLERSPVIATVSDDNFKMAFKSPVETIFHLKASLGSISEDVTAAHNANKKLFVHIDLAEGIGKDKAAIEYLADCGADGILTTRTQLVRFAEVGIPVIAGGLIETKAEVTDALKNGAEAVSTGEISLWYM